MTVFVGNLDEALKPQDGEERYLYRYFSGGPALFQKFVAAMPKTWRVHSFQTQQGMPVVLFEVGTK